jgi:tRNA pseudouridine55 synthase
LDLTLVQDDQGHPAVKMRVTCSKGTYIRTLGEDMGEALGCGAHLRFLRRWKPAVLNVALRDAAGAGSHER